MALIMMPVGLFLVWQGGWWLAIGCIIGALILGAEWSAMAALPKNWVMMAASALPIVVFMIAGLRSALLALWVFGALAALLQSRDARTVLQTLLGTLYTAGIPLALLVLREGEWNGRLAALMLMGMVWASDSGAFFSGRALGGPLLAPAISPKKTWSGAGGAILCTGLCGFIAAHLTGSPPFRWVLFSAGLSVVAQYGDLIESKIKRDFGAKDASGLIPGHGGLMDRVDGLGAVCIASASLFVIFPQLYTYLGLAG